jgi:hypothetical protein
MVHSVQTVHLYCTDTKLSRNRPKWDSTWSTHPGFHRVCLRWFPRLWYFLVQTAHLSYVKISTILKQTQTKLPLEPRRLGVSLGVSKTISEPIVRSAQTVHLVKISTISKRTKTSFHLSPVTLEFHQVRPIRFLSLRYVQSKPCTYIAPTLTMSTNGPKRDSTWPTHLGVPSVFFKMIFRAYGTFGTNHATILCQD